MEAGRNGGGGAYNDATSTLTLTKSSVNHNHANGSPGIGGGIYTLGTFSFDPLSRINSIQCASEYICRSSSSFAARLRGASAVGGDSGLAVVFMGSPVRR